MRDRFRFSVLPVVALLTFAGCLEPTHLERNWEVLGLSASAEVYTTISRDAPILLDKIEDAQNFQFSFHRCLSNSPVRM